MVALYAVWYNFVRHYKALRMSPAMTAGISDRLWGMEGLIALIDAREGAPKKCGPYKNREC